MTPPGRARIRRFEIAPEGPFSLAAARDFLGGFTPATGSWTESATGVVMAFPVEGWSGSAAAAVRQDEDGVVRGEIAAPAGVRADAVRAQVARTLSLDHDGRGFARVGRRDPLVGRLQRSFPRLRPVCFYSPYEAASSAVIAHRVSMRQAAGVKTRLAEAFGDAVEVGGRAMHAFPSPQALLRVESFPGLIPEKVVRLRAVAEAALDGVLEAEHLRSLAPADALKQLREIRGIGEWSAQHVLLRGCGLADELPMADPRTRDAVQAAYGLDAPPDDAELQRIAEAWRPYRMWVCVLLRVWIGRKQGERGSRDAGEPDERPTRARRAARRSAPR